MKQETKTTIIDAMNAHIDAVAGKQQPQDTSTRKDEYISKDLWRDDDGFIAQGSGDNYITFADTNVNDDDIDDRERRTDEIIEAYNGTIAKGYNPAAMEELYKALGIVTEKLRLSLEYWKVTKDGDNFLQSEYEDNMSCYGAVHNANKILENAKTIKP